MIQVKALEPISRSPSIYKGCLKALVGCLLRLWTSSHNVLVYKLAVRFLGSRRSQTDKKQEMHLHAARRIPTWLAAKKLRAVAFIKSLDILPSPVRKNKKIIHQPHTSLRLNAPPHRLTRYYWCSTKRPRSFSTPQTLYKESVLNLNSIEKERAFWPLHNATDCLTWLHRRIHDK